MTLKQLIERGKGRANAWRCERPGNGTTELWHYGTRMLVWSTRPDGVEVIDYSLGWGSVSDQNGMNTAFRSLGLPYYYSRANGAHIEGGI